jgi:transglutaminase-like putative cysteine protease
MPGHHGRPHLEGEFLVEPLVTSGAPMNRTLLAVLAAFPLVACPEQRPAPVRAPPRPAQAALAAGQAAVDILTVPRPEGPEWFGLYLVGKKAGWTKAHLTREIRDGKDVLVGRSEMLLKVNVGGNVVERRQTEERVWEARPGGRLLAFKAVFAGDGGERTLSGTCNARERCTAVIEAAGGKEERVIEGVGETADLADGARIAAARRSAVRGRQLDLVKLRVREVEDVFLRRERIAGAGVQEEVAVVAEQEVGDRLAVEYRIADDGRLVEMRLGEAIVGRPESEERSKKLEEVDLFALGRVPVPRTLPRTVPAAITYRLKGVPAGFRKDDLRQRWRRGAESLAAVTVSARPPAAVDGAKDTPLARAAQGASAEDLAATPQVDFDAPAIRALAREVAGDAPGAYATAVRLSAWVHEHLEKAYGASKDRASEVLEARRGDCTEHAVLLVALSRALGIPARQVYGLVYARYADGVDALYWHAWAEVRSGGEWIALDPIFGQPVADATHLALGRGRQEDAVGLLGSLEVVGVDVKER